MQSDSLKINNNNKKNKLKTDGLVQEFAKDLKEIKNKKKDWFIYILWYNIESDLHVDVDDGDDDAWHLTCTLAM